ncbi:pyridoxamine 5'-phosphate oxidase family protein [Rhodosalinus sp. FB01]|uniref:pyridoxamine 5'-phosphate oxidase family protein n=1 Tax=Rhodosalinus sp. FB01 TaxID=3239194 RepID=UPI0035254FA7
MSEWFETLEGLRARVWQRLGRGVADRRAPARHPTLATLGTDGAPEARTVVLRGSSEAAGSVTIYTDAASAKVAELAREPRATLHVWEPKDRLQIRLALTVELRTGASLDALWERLSPEARRAYGGRPEPGRPIGDPVADYEETRERARFAVLDGRVERIEALHLGDWHRRADFSRADGFAGAWIAP